MSRWSWALRYDLNVAPTEAEDRFVYFDPGTVSLQQVGQGVRDKIYGNKHNFQPRVGVVWDPFKRRPDLRAGRLRAPERPAGDEHGHPDLREPTPCRAL